MAPATPHDRSRGSMVPWNYASRVSMRNPAQERTGTGNELHTQLRSRTRSATTGFAVLRRSGDTRRGSLQKAELRTRTTPGPERRDPRSWKGPVGEIGGHASLRTRILGACLPEGRFDSLTGHEDVLCILCFQHKISCPLQGGQARQRVRGLGPDPGFTARRCARHSHAYAAVAMNASVTNGRVGSNPTLDLSRQGSSIGKSAKNAERRFAGLKIQKEWSGTISKMPIPESDVGSTGPVCCP